MNFRNPFRLVVPLALFLSALLFSGLAAETAGGGNCTNTSCFASNVCTFFQGQECSISGPTGPCTTSNCQ